MKRERLLARRREETRRRVRSHDVILRRSATAHGDAIVEPQGDAEAVITGAEIRGGGWDADGDHGRTNVESGKGKKASILLPIRAHLAPASAGQFAARVATHRFLKTPP